MKKHAALICFLVGGLLQVVLSPSVEARGGWVCSGGTWGPKKSGVSSTPPAKTDRQKTAGQHFVKTPSNGAWQVNHTYHVRILQKLEKSGWIVSHGDVPLSMWHEGKMEINKGVNIMTESVYSAIAEFVSRPPEGTVHTVTTETGEKLVFSKTSWSSKPKGHRENGGPCFVFPMYLAGSASGWLMRKISQSAICGYTYLISDSRHNFIFRVRDLSITCEHIKNPFLCGRDFLVVRLKLRDVRFL